MPSTEHRAEHCASRIEHRAPSSPIAQCHRPVPSPSTIRWLGVHGVGVHGVGVLNCVGLAAGLGELPNGRQPARRTWMQRYLGTKSMHCSHLGNTYHVYTYIHVA